MNEPPDELPQELVQALKSLAGAAAARDMGALAAVLEKLSRASVPVAQRLSIAAQVGAVARSVGHAETEGRLLNLQGLLLTESGNLDDARSALQRCIHIANAAQIRDLQWKAETTLGIGRAMAGELTVAMGHLENAVNAATLAGDLRAVGRTLINIGNTQNEMGLEAQAAETAQRAIEIARDINDAGALLSATVLLGLSQMHAADFELAESTFLGAIPFAQAQQAWRTVGNLHGNIAVGRHRRGYIARARAHYAEAAQHFERAGARQEAGATLGALGGLFIDEGEFERALEPLQRSIDVHLQGGDLADAAQSMAALADAHIGLGKLELATNQLMRASELCSDDSPPEVRFELLGCQTRLALAQGKFVQALQVAGAHRRLARVLNMPGQEGLALSNAAQVHEAAGDCPQAESAAEESLALLEQAGLVPGTRQLEMLTLQARLMLRAGRNTDAASLLEYAHRAADKLPLFQESEGAKVQALAAELRRLEKAASRS